MKKTAIVAAIASLTLALGGVGTVVLLQDGTVTVDAPSTLVAQQNPAPESENETAPASGNENAPLPGNAAQPQAETPAGTTSREEAGTGKEKTGQAQDDGETIEPVGEQQPVADVTAPASAAETETVRTSDGEKADAGSAQVSGAAESGNNASAAGNDGQSGAASGNSSPEQDNTQQAQTAASSGEVVRLTNAERSKNGLPDLKTETAIQEAADLRAREVATRFEHIRPDGSSFSTAIPGSYARYGENIAYSSGKVSAEQFLSLWMASTGHRANILNADYTGIAVGVYYDAQANITYAVQLFVTEAEKVEYTYTDTVVAPTCTEQGYTLHTCNEDDSKSYKDTYTDALGHDWDDGAVTTEASCTAAGEKTFTCRRCQETRTEEIPAAGHQTELQNAREATCTEDGYTGDTVCTVCGEVIQQGEAIPATGHQTELQNAREATCTEDGYTGDTVCTVCGEVTQQGEAIPAAGHQTELQNATEATCTEDGYTGDTVCTVCGEVIQQGEAIPAAGHHFVDGQCTVCGDPDPDYKPEVEYTYTDTIVAPTCTEQGYTLHTCNEDDSKSYRDTYTDALGHDWDDGAVTTEASCTAAGQKTFTCQRCQETRTEEIPAIGHQTELQNAKEATCTEDGYTGDTVCTVCGEVIQQGEAIPAAGHHFVDGQCTVCGDPDPDYKPEVEYTYTDTIVAPTCTEQGYTLHTCNEDASKSYKDTYTDALGHSFDGNNLGAQCIRCHTELFTFSYTVEPTCQDGGYDVYTSILDPNEIRRSNFTDPLDHNYVDGYCTMCHAKEPGIPSYDSNYDKTYYNNVLSDLTNQARHERGHSALRYASEYQAAADTRAQELVSSFSHTRPDGREPDTALKEAGATFESFGENIAYVSSMYKPGRIMDNWLASASHCSNMMRDTIDSFVVGTACSNGRVYAVQIFFKDLSSGENAAQTMSLDEEPAEESDAAETVLAAQTPAAAQAPALTVAQTPAPTPVPTEEPAVAEEPAVPEQTSAPQVTEPAEPAEETAAAPAMTAEPEAAVSAGTAPVETAPAQEEQPEAAPSGEAEETAPAADAPAEELPPQQETVILPEQQEILPQAEPAPEDTTPDPAV